MNESGEVCYVSPKAEMDFSSSGQPMSPAKSLAASCAVFFSFGPSHFVMASKSETGTVFCATSSCPSIRLWCLKCRNPCHVGALLIIQGASFINMVHTIKRDSSPSTILRAWILSDNSSSRLSKLFVVTRFWGRRAYSLTSSILRLSIR